MRRLVRAVAGLFCLSFCLPLAGVAATISPQSGDIVAYISRVYYWYSAAWCGLAGICHPYRHQHCRLAAGCAVPGVGYQTAVSVFAAVFPCSLRISAVVQGASFKADPLAPGSFFSVFGDGLGT